MKINKLHLKPLFFSTIFFLCCAGMQAQDKKPLDHSVYDNWESLGNITVPYNGKYAIYSVNKQEGDNVLHLYDIQNNTDTAFPRGKNAAISMDGQQLIYCIAPLYSQIREAKIKKKKGVDMPKDTLVIMDLKTRESQKIPFLKTYRYGNELGSHVAYQTEEPADTSAKAKKTPGDAGTPLIVLNIKTKQADTIKFVEKYNVSDDGSIIAYITKPAKKDTVTSRGLYLYNILSKEVRTLIEGDKKMKIELPSFEQEGTRVAFYAQPDTAKAQQKFMNIYCYDMAAVAGESAKILISNETDGIPEGWMIGSRFSLKFSDPKSSLSSNGGALFLGIKPIPEEEDTTVADFEKVKLDIWVWDDDYLPTYKEARKAEFENLVYLSVLYFSDTSKIIRLEDKAVDNVRIPDELKGDYILTAADKPYRVLRQWDTNPRCDLYKLNVRTGEYSLLQKEARISTPMASPYGTYYTWYDSIDRNWYIYDMTTGASRNLTSSFTYPFWDEDNDVPGLPGAYSYAVWAEGESYFVLGDRYDLWQFDPKGAAAPFMITEGIGRRTSTLFKIIRPIYDPKTLRSRMAAPLKKTEPLFFSSFNRVTRDGGFYMKDITKKKAKMVKLAEGPYTYKLSGISMSNEYPGIALIGKGNKPPRKLSVPVFVYTKANTVNSPNVFISKDMLRNEQKISSTNPQQKDYNWLTVEMVSWLTADSIRSEGLLYKPENFDPAKKYPMIIYFYEKYSDEINTYRAPSPSRSTVNFPYFASNGYLVFVPDIYYGKPLSGQFLDGNPGQCALNAILPAVDMLCKNSWVDSDHIAIQGQSWGGYQVAYMITQTDRFAAAGAGAPVSNMTSAYGGIRWGTGVTRQMQYENGQSRIGKNLWEDFDRYYKNSPLFYVPNVKTPVLIMHNDKDTAVPWYQGIEFFAALRHEGKQAWMLQYKGEDHNLRERHNCKDLSVRLGEFFDHFLKGAPEPEWMKTE